ncbi:DJ-1/PfpI family protein [Flavisolibacter tropicus]|uniref:DJ-1/PfpI domain-containing protein n=1 Tax=Flavisolibacter tropicus TaxID=1492898 RepID=A0A172U141_9BACT|nr:DJ-1/PfpI family protein [Flavisolibacter tropicus]ANE53071.1 hypothetical protein SY85_23950 [Flavisolibacter tropicus]
MKNLKQILVSAFTTILIVSLVLYFTVSHVFAQNLKTYKGDNNFSWSVPKLDSAKKTVFIIASNAGTEMFDFMAPYYLFNATGQANVYVVAEKKAPVLLVNSLFILPHYTFSEIDSMQITPDVIVIPNVTIHLKEPPKEIIVNWVKSQCKETTILLAICDGAATAAATGLYDGKPLTTHASDLGKLKKKFPKPLWVANTSVTESGNLYSTAGVSNATEGSLTVIKRVFGEETMQTVRKDIHYQQDTIKVAHQSKVVTTGTITRIIAKKAFQKDYKVGVLISDHVNEFELASLLDTYTRTFPASLNTFTINGAPVTSKFGLQLYPTGEVKNNNVNELHVINARASQLAGHPLFPKAKVVAYTTASAQYPIELYLDRIGLLYGDKFKSCVKLMLDYN